MKHKFKTPFTFEGKEYTELDMDLDGLTGKDMIQASKEARVLGDVTPVQEVSMIYLAVIAAKAAKVPVDMIQDLPSREFSKVKILVQNFLLE